MGELINCLLNTLIDETDYDSDMEIGVEQLEDELDSLGFNIRSGATKVAVFSEEDCCLSVIKIPANYDYEEDCFFCNAHEGSGIYEGEEEWDYCHEEELIYGLAKQNFCDNFFAETKKIGSFKSGHPIYTQEKCTAWCEVVDNYEYSKESLKMVETKMSRFNGYCRLEKDWLAVAMEFYGEDEFENFLSFLEGYNVNDLHRGNYGFNQFGEPKIFDYSGYHEDY